LKCHVLIDLKIRAFSYADVGQMNFYLNYYRKNKLQDGDNLPVGIVLCTDKEETKVEYATAGLDNKLFVSKYMVELPKKEDLEALLREN
ncbi:MAG: PDDEXK nuclease domain-containing protein, partial [Nitrospinales bacterium]